ncbi:glycoside hydrolase family 92 protein [Aulographum hederae CBS 113979]|uniref:Glycoside hydrolase family 92 protein n=1 Tax=Aulographum hederae CBS 113979 TaxID=1176131 RepID=A0A6G1HBF9_9PEZI|nr:glycoside hydrolase family 92 protein [Aulographum hederae CBS 113979]
MGPDVQLNGTDAYSGYLPDGNITGFSMMHESGTGGAPKYGVVSQLPVVGNISNPLVDLSVPRASADEAEVGYYKSFLANGVTVQLAATEHAALYSYEFPPSQKANVLVDVSHVLPSFRGLGWGQGYAGGELKWDGEKYQGHGIHNNGWNLSPDWTIYFCGRFSTKPKESRLFSGNGTTLSSYGNQSSVAGSERVGGIFSFNGTHIISRVGISFISSNKACKNLDAELPAGATIQSLKQKAQKRWDQEVFSKISTTDTNVTNLGLLYTSLYGMHLIPSNRTGENPKWNSTEPYYDDIFTFWDLFRCTTALVGVLQPVAFEEQIRSLIDIFRHDGYMPDARSSNYNGRTQGGSNADNVLADAYVKGVRGAVNWEDGYAAMVKDAEVTPLNNHDPSAPDSSTKEGRGAIPDWLQYGYITPRFSRAVSRAVEYSVNDFSLSQVATGLGHSDDTAKYLNRSLNWRNHWNPRASALNISGFVVPRAENGSFIHQDPLDCGGCYWGDAYYEGKPFEYSMNAHHDIDTVIAYSNGTEGFIKRLDALMDPANDIFDVGNEPSFTSPYLYSFVNRQDLAVQQSRRVAKDNYGLGPTGLPGNSDAGAMQSWILWNIIGLYPMTGQTTFLVGSPWFEQMTIQLGEGKTLEITSSGGNSDTAFYVQSLKVNGVEWDRGWITWDDVFKEGGRLEFVLGSEKKVWTTGERPPSPASGR